MKKSALPIGQFTKTEHGYTGKLETIAHKGVTLTLQPNEDKEKDSHPDFVVLHGQTEIGVAWNQEDDRGFYVSIVFEEPSLAPGSYKLIKTGVEKSYELRYRKPYNKKDK